MSPVLRHPRGGAFVYEVVSDHFVLAASGALALACAVPGVHVVWTILAGTVSMTVAYLLPPLMYLKLRAYRPWNWRKSVAVLLIVIAVFTAVTSTYETLRRLGNSSSCPAAFNPCAQDSTDSPF